ncbi:MAG: hypothetical protein M5U01_01560 [Ardenticatenaceae bacterium]|nr:hypothetical protein [Ardenticatenaceae bacterium]HBY97473.1 hypothetical protein [Chloroflexota bacterium]
MWVENIIREIQRQVGGGRRTVNVAAGGAALTAEVRQADSLAGALDSLTVVLPGVPPALDEAGRTLASSVTYLLEPLAVLEIGTDRVLLRSRPPRTRDRSAEYYELWLRAAGESTAVDLRRYRTQRHQSGREVLPMTFTWEQVLHLLNDLETIFL